MSLTVLVYGHPGSGKSPVLATAPGRTLWLAAESGYRHIEREKVLWDPRSAMPKDIPEGSMTVVRLLPDTVGPSPDVWDNARRVLEILVSGKHQFDSVAVDTLSSLQNHVISYATSKSRRGEMDQQGWGIVLRELMAYVSILTDQVDNARKPLDIVAASAELAERKEGETEFTPDVSGSARKALIQMFDVLGFLVVSSSFDPSTGAPQATDRRMAIVPGYGAQARDRTSTRQDGGLSRILGSPEGVLSGPIDLAELNRIVTK